MEHKLIPRQLWTTLLFRKDVAQFWMTQQPLVAIILVHLTIHCVDFHVKINKLRSIGLGKLENHPTDHQIPDPRLGFSIVVLTYWLARLDVCLTIGHKLPAVPWPSIAFDLELFVTRFRFISTCLEVVRVD